ncbi:MAG: peptide chain release factor-like protein [Verrucomicrobia bacterium]|nr:peptide chain release factor-like protein [Verrucomicrobiota bacterium]MBS0647448.1 peptide chain release factor-like protein [Verrucomicrobiota bacterium]
MISRQKWEALEKRLTDLGVQQEDMTIKSILGSGPGGQHVNKKATTVYLKHHPTEIEIKCGQERSQTLNMYRALQTLCDKLEQLQKGEQSKLAKEAAKIRKQKQRRSRRQKHKLVEQKRELTEKKELRKPPKED